MNLTTAQLAALRECPGQPGGRWPSTDAEAAVLEELCELGLVRRLRAHRYRDGKRVDMLGYQRTPAGGEAATG